MKRKIKALLLKRTALQEVSKRQRGGQHGEPVVSHALETRLHIDSFSLISSAHSDSLPFVPTSLSHPPLSLHFLEAYNEICRCELTLNACTTPVEIHDVLLDSYMLYHRVHDRVDRYSDLNDRILELEYNAHLKQLRSCSQIVRAAAQLADDIKSFEYTNIASLPSQEECADSLRVTDEAVQYFHPALKHLYITDIRPVLVRHWLYDPSTTPDSSSRPSESPEFIYSSPGVSPTHSNGQ